MKRRFAFFSILAFALSSLARRARRSLSLGFGLTLIAFLFSATLFLHDAISAEYERLIPGMAELSVHQLRGGRPERIEGDALAELEAHPGVRSISPRVWGYLYLPPISANITVMAVNHEPSLPTLLRGELPTSEGDLAIGDRLARALGLRPGDSIALPGAAGFQLFSVKGVFSSDSSLLSGDLALFTEPDARTLLGYDDALYTDLAIHLSSPTEAPAIAARVEKILPNARIVERSAIERAYALSFGQRAGFLAALILPILGCFLIIAWDRLSGSSDEERYEAGVLLVSGWEFRDILTLRILESGLLSGIAASLGILFAYAYLFLFDAPLLTELLLGWSSLHPKFNLTPMLSGAQLLMLLSLLVLPYTAISILPAFRSASVDANELLRGGR